MEELKHENLSLLQGSTTNVLIFFTLLFIVLKITKIKVSSKEEKIEKDCVGLEALPKVRNVVPLKLIGVIPYFWRLSKIFETAQGIYEQMGDLFRVEALGQDFVQFNSGPTLKALLKSADLGHLHKAPLVYDRMKPFINNGVLVSDGPFWQKQRKVLLKSQSYQNLRGYMEMLNRHSKNMVTSLESRFMDGETHTINDLINVAFLDIINEMITGKSLDQSEEMHAYHKNFTFWKDTIPYKALNPLFLIEVLWKLHPRYKKYETACKYLSDFAKRRINEVKDQRENNNSTQGNRSAFRSVIQELLDAGVDDQQIVDEINTMMFGGHETGATAIHCLCFLLALNLEVQTHARKEVDEVFTNLRMEDALTFDVVQSELKYLERVILEGLRLLPPVFVVFRKLLSTLKIDCEGKNVVISSGTNCIIFPFVTHRMEKYYPNPLKFDPDRFLPEQMKKRHPYTYIPFSAGPRACLGQKFAMLEMKVVMAYILRNFEMSTTDKMEDVTWLPCTTTTPANHFAFQFMKRQV